MPEYLAPGVYVEEIATGPVPIEGVSTSTAGFVGLSERGPSEPRLVTSWIDFQRWYGGLSDPEGDLDVLSGPQSRPHPIRVLDARRGQRQRARGRPEQHARVRLVEASSRHSTGEEVTGRHDRHEENGGKSSEQP